MKENELVVGNVPKALLRFSIPFIISTTLQALYGAADLFVIGRFCDAAALSAVSIGSQLMQMITSIVLGIGTGVTVLIGRKIGEKDGEGAADAIGTTTVLLAIIAILLTPTVLLLTGGFVEVMKTPEAAISGTLGYLRICAIGIPFIIGYNALSSIFCGLGDSKTPAIFVAIACAINIIVDFILVGGFGMGAEGAAIATVLAQTISFITALFKIRRTGFSFTFGRKNVRLKRAPAIEILRIGIPIAVQNVLVNISFLIITAIINTMGLNESAAVGVVEKLIGFFILPITAISSAVSTMTAQNIGASKPERALKSLKFGIIYSLVFSCVVYVFVFLFPESFTAIFSSNSEVIKIAAEYLVTYTLDCLLLSFVFNMNAYFNGNGRALFTVIHSLAATFGLRIPLSFFISRIEGVTLFEMGFAPPLSTLLSLVMCIIYFAVMKRKNNKTIKQ